MKHKILVETSARHVHLTEEHFKILFGEDATLTFKKELSQPGQFAAEERVAIVGPRKTRSEEHTSELQSRPHLVCRLLLEKKKKHEKIHQHENRKLPTRQRSLFALQPNALFPANIVRTGRRLLPSTVTNGTTTHSRLASPN